MFLLTNKVILRGTKNKISKQGSPYLQCAIWQAAFITSFKDPALSQYYQKLRARVKYHSTAIGAVARKLVKEKAYLLCFFFTKNSSMNSSNSS